jgi:hypothetical protein
MIHPYSRSLRPRFTGVLVANLAAAPFVALAVATGHLWEFVALGTAAGCAAWDAYDRRSQVAQP